MPVLGLADGVSSPDIATSIELLKSRFLDVPLYKSVLAILFQPLKVCKGKGKPASRPPAGLYGAKVG